MSNTDPTVDRLKKLVDEVADGNANEASMRELESLLQINAEARDYYRVVMSLHAELRWLHRAENVDTNPDLSIPERVFARFGANVISRWPSISGRAAAATVVLGLFLVYSIASWRSQSGAVGKRANAVTIAELRSNRDCIWKNAAHPMTDGAPLASGEQLRLEQGIAKLQFKGGASVVIESPASFELVTSNSMRLDRGTVAVRANGPQKDFVVESREASIVDLGTSFGVHCDDCGNTDVEVFEGTVEVYPQGNSKQAGKVLGLGATARFQINDRGSCVDLTAPEQDRFGELIKLLWEDMPRRADVAAEDESGTVIEARFDDAPNPGTVDTFYGAIAGRGWLTPWVASGNPRGDVLRENPLSGNDDPYLHVRFFRSNHRVIAREYGPRPGFDPSQPHVISWKWRFEGSKDQFTSNFGDRVNFYGNPYFQRNSSASNTWSIGIVGASEKSGDRRKVFPKHWYVFDGHEGKKGDDFERRNMVDTGMTLKPEIVYQFAVAVYPSAARYDVAIRDDEQTFVRSGLSFRNRTAGSANVIHFGMQNGNLDCSASFSLDSVRIEPFIGNDLEKQLKP